MATAYLTPGVYVEEVSSGPKPIEGVGTAVAAFLGVAEKGPIGKATLVTNWTQFTDTFGEFVPNAYLAHAVYAYFNNGGSVCFVVRIGKEEAVAPAAPALPESAIANKAGGATTLRAIAKAPSGAPVTVEVSEGPDDSFNLTIKAGTEEEKYEGLTFGRGPKNVVEATKGSKLATIEEVRVAGASIAERAPAPGTYPLALPQVAALATAEAASPEIYEGNTADRTGLGGLEAIDQITMVAAPDIMAAYKLGALDMDGVKAVQLAMIAHCERMGRVAIIDCPPNLKAQEILEWRSGVAGYDSKYAALYYPWVKVADPTPGADSTTMWMPPSAHLAGLWARSDSERGVHKAPANEVLRGVLDIEVNVTSAEQGLLNPVGINCIRSFPNRGIRVWGARTLSSDPEWRYLNVRRLFNYVEKSIENGTQWVVFEPNDFFLWSRVKRDISSFLTTVWRQGALFGRTPEEAFFVKCDEENNPAATRDVGQLWIDIGIAPVKPAEFVIFRIGQFTPGA